MRIQRSDVSYDCALNALARLGFKVVKADGLMCEFRKGKLKPLRSLKRTSVEKESH
jgi:hypothetical protein